MQNKQNLHMHTVYTDGKDQPEEMVLEAIRRGFDSVGFSEHSYMRYSRSHQMLLEQTGAYQAEILSLKEKYRGAIDIYCGLEVELFSEMPQESFDYLIGSVHYLECDGQIAGFDRGLEETLSYVNKYFGGDGLAFAKHYFRTLCSLPEKADFDILGHFDLITKNNEKGRFIDTSSREYLHAGFEAIHALRGKIPLFEVNTGAIARGYRADPYPQREFLRELQSCGFGAVISSDCHDKNFIDCHYEEARQLLLQAGFQSRWILTEGGFREVAV